MKEVKTDRHNSDKRHSRQPIWRSVKFVATIPVEANTNNNNNNKYPAIPEHEPIEDIYNQQPSTPSSIHTIDRQKSRLSNWLSHQVQEHDHYSPHTWIEHDDNATTISNLSVVSHVSTDMMTTITPPSLPIKTITRERSSSLPTNPSIPDTSSHYLIKKNHAPN
ncbi:hypothetical protein BJ944DRAFT_273083, partial [Cunninghamella echinulata]